MGCYFSSYTSMVYPLVVSHNKALMSYAATSSQEPANKCYSLPVTHCSPLSSQISRNTHISRVLRGAVRGMQVEWRFSFRHFA